MTAAFQFLVVISALISRIYCSPTGNQTLISLDQAALTALLIPFREALLHRVAVDWNHTLTDSQRLQADLQVCSDKIKASVQTCEYCTEAACKDTETVAQVSHSPGFTDYLKFAAAIVNPYTYLKEPLQEIGDKFGDLKDLLGDGSDAFIDSMAALGKTVGGEFSNAFSTIESAFNSFGGSVTGIGNTAIGGIKDVAGSIGDGLSSAGNAIKDLGNSVLHGIGSIFGRRTTPLDPKIRQCMEQCSSCDALLLPQRRDMVTRVCGADVVRFNDTVRSTVATIKSIYSAVADKTHPIIIDLVHQNAALCGNGLRSLFETKKMKEVIRWGPRQVGGVAFRSARCAFCVDVQHEFRNVNGVNAAVQYDPTSANGILINRIFVTTNVGGRYVTYQSSFRYNMVNIGITAQELALEYWTKWTD